MGLRSARSRATVALVLLGTSACAATPGRPPQTSRETQLDVPRMSRDGAQAAHHDPPSCTLEEGANEELCSRRCGAEHLVKLRDVLHELKTNHSYWPLAEAWKLSTYEIAFASTTPAQLVVGRDHEGAVLVLAFGLDPIELSARGLQGAPPTSSSFYGQVGARFGLRSAGFDQILRAGESLTVNVTGGGCVLIASFE